MLPFHIQMNNSTSVLHKIANLYAEQLMSDICLVVGANRYPAHRVILCASSEVFQVMLMNPEWNECRESVIELKEEPCCLEVFPQFLKYLYVGQIRISLQSVMPMLALADKYNIKVSSKNWIQMRHFHYIAMYDLIPIGSGAIVRRLHAEAHIESRHAGLPHILAALYNIVQSVSSRSHECHTEFPKVELGHCGRSEGFRRSRY